jgi:hypothetical protein
MDNPPASSPPNPNTSTHLLAGGLVVVLAFLQAAFVARNSDIWMHLAVGRSLVAGQFRFGVDPFSYATVGTYWVHHAWLFGLVQYGLYSLAGWLPVLVKASLFATTILLLQRIRQSQVMSWPVVIVSGLAVLACSPRLTLQPLVGSLLLLTLTLQLLEWVRAARTRRQLAVYCGLVALVQALWVNWDSWFFLGPIVIGLMTVGEALTGSNRSPTAAAQTRRLAAALGVAVLATLANPHGWWAWTLPPELVSPQLIGILRQDVLLRLGALTALDHWAEPAFGLNLCGLAYALLLVGAVVVPWLDRERLRYGDALVLACLAILSLAHARLIPFFAIAAVPIISDHLARLTRGWGVSRFSQQAGIAGVLLVLSGCVLAYPGWLHPEPPVPWHVRYHGYSIEPDPEMVELAQHLRSLRESGRVPVGWRGYHYHPDFIYYCAWFAPGEKGLFDYRYALFDATVSDYLQVRNWLNSLPLEPDPRLPPGISKILRDRGIRYLVLTGLQRDNALPILQTLWRVDEQWAMWYLDGNSAILGRLDPDSDPSERQRIARLHVDFAKLAFDRDDVPLASSEPKQELRKTPRAWWERFSGPPSPLSTETTRAELLLSYADFLRERAVARLQAYWLLTGSRWMTGQPNGLGMALDLFAAETVITPLDRTNLQALPLLAAQAARRAIRDNPNDAEAYFYLARAYELLALTPNDPLRRVQALWALRMGSDRIRFSELPYRRPQLVLRGMETLINLYVRNGAKDLANEITRKQLGYAEQLPGFDESNLQLLQARYQEQSQELEKARAQLEQEREGRPFTDQLELCLKLGLVREAMLSVRSLDFRDPNPALIDRIIEVNLGIAGEALRAREMLRQTIGSGRTLRFRQWQVAFLVQRAMIDAVLGDFATSGNALEEAIALLLYNPPVVPFNPALDLLPIHQPGRLLVAMMNQPQVFANRLQSMTNLHLLRAQMALEEGDIPVALHHLRQAAAATRWGLRTAETAVAESLLQLIQNARE